jgi:hypothetical protein
MPGKSKIKLGLLWLLAAVLISSAVVPGNDGPRFDEKDTAAIIKASYIYNFSKLIDWPEENKKGNFVIGVMGGSSMYQQLVTKYHGKTIGSQPIEIRKIANPQNFNSCHVLFVDHEFSQDLETVARTINGSNTLLIAHADNGLKRGAAINFVVVDDNLKFELSVANADRSNLFVGSTLKSLALHVEN